MKITAAGSNWNFPN